jgi:hypothetical protein
MAINRYGLTWEAIAAYHVGEGNIDRDQETRKRAEDYAKKVFQRYQEMQKIP